MNAKQRITKLEKRRKPKAYTWREFVEGRAKIDPDEWRKFLEKTQKELDQ
jgi:hypothetical protein